MAIQLYQPPLYTYSQWLITQIYTGDENILGPNQGNVVPNVNDSVVEYKDGAMYFHQVAAVDQMTRLSTLVPMETPSQTNDEPIIGAPFGVGNLSNIANLYFNPTDPKLSCSVDANIEFRGNNLAYAKIFDGTDIGQNGSVLSIRYDQTGDVIDDKIEFALTDETDPTLLKYTARSGNLDRILQEDHVVTLVIYNDIDAAVAFYTLKITHSNIVNNVQANISFIDGLYLDSSYIDPLDPLRLLIPKNLINNSFSPRIFLSYNTGQKQELFIGTSNIKIQGWNDEVSDEVGEEFPMVVTYGMGVGERSTINNPHSGNTISTTYTVTVVSDPVDEQLKLFVVPRFVGGVTGWTLEYWLYNLSREYNVNVTEHVTNENAFNGVDYINKQHLALKLNLIDVNPAYPDIEYVDDIDIQLYGGPLDTTTTYNLWYYRDDSRYYGDDLRVRIDTTDGINTLTLHNDIMVFSDWLERSVYQATPLYDPNIEDNAMQPTHVDVEIDGVVVTLDINTYWSGAVPWTEAVPSPGANCRLSWYAFNGSSERLEIAKTGLVLEVV